ncbi:MAG: UbiA family prenyltransferase [Granulosicoccus sp.]
MSSPQTEIDPDFPLCVDLDGSFLKTDMLFESVLCLLKSRPWLVFNVVFWFIGGKANLKAQISRRVDISQLPLPVNERLLDCLVAASESRRIILVTGSNQRVADAIKKRYPLFSEAYGSDDQVNLTGRDKQKLLIKLYGEKGFDYVGNDTPDRKVWLVARNSWFAGLSSDQPRYADIRFEKNLSHEGGGLRGVLKMIRLHQWTKNLLILVPLFLDQQLGHLYSVAMALLGFLAFSMMASATYIINDLLDLASDRQNSTKQHRPLACGSISIKHGIMVSAGLLGAAVCLALILPPSFALLMLVYLVTTLAYSFALKKEVILDVITIAVLHTLRIIGGTLVIEAEHSFWLLAFSVFIFTSFALAKRVSELTNLKNEGREAANGRGYSVADLPLLTSAGVAAGYVAVLVIALFINSEKVLQNYSRPEVLWVLCPGFLYWIGRLWLMTSRGKVHEDPIVYVLKDRASLFTLLCFLMVVSIGFLL